MSEEQESSENSQSVNDKEIEEEKEKEKEKKIEKNKISEEKKEIIHQNLKEIKEEIKQEEESNENDDPKQEIIDHKISDQGKEYLLNVKASNNSIDFSCIQVDDKNNIYLSNINFLEAKKKHKYLKGAESPEELIEALYEFVDTTKISLNINKPNIMKIIFTITYLKKTDTVTFDLNKKIIPKEEVVSFKGDGKISTIDKQIKKIALNHIDLNKKVAKIITVNENIMKKYDDSNKKIDEIENNLQILSQNIENLSNIIKDYKPEQNENDIREFKQEITYSNTQKYKIEEYIEEKSISSKNYTYTFIQLKNGLILIGYKSGLIKVYEPLNYSLLIEVSVHKKNINNIIELSSGFIASCSLDKSFVITKLNYDNKSYEEIQKIERNSSVYKLMEINGLYLLSSDCENIEVWRKNHMSKYDYYRNLKIGKNIYGLLQVSPKLFVAHVGLRTLQFYNIDNFNFVKELNEIPTRLYNNLVMITDDILCIGSTEKLFLISVSKMEIINVANIDKCGIESLVMLPDETLLAGVTYPIDNFPSYNFIQFKLNENLNLEIVSTKKMVHSWTIFDLKCINIYGRNKIASCGSMDCTIKIWS